MLGERLGKWVIFKEIGRGGMGAVYLAREEIGGRQAAIKVLAPELSKDAGFLQRFQQEMEILAKLSHPGIVQFYEAGQENGVTFYAMEYVEGQSLDDVLHENGKLPWKEALNVAIQVAPALRHVHDHGVIHRDLKPSNLLRMADGTVKLTDFGIAKVFAADHLTATGGVVGTAEYLSPEQAGGKQVGKRSDLYSLGVVLYHLIVGKPPFDGKTMVDLLHKHIYGQFDPPRRYVPELPYELDELICQMMSKEPAKRPADALVLSKQLDKIRRRLDKKSSPTHIGLVEESGTVAENQPVRQGGPGPATIMSHLMREELQRQVQGGPIAQFFNRFWVLFPLLLLCVGILVWTFWPASMESLYSRGAQLMESNRLSDMEQAWREYLGPLNERFPDHPYQDKVSEFKARLDAARSPVSSEAERFFHLGEKLLESGEAGEASRVWAGVVDVFNDVEAERHWVRKSEKALNELESKERTQQIWAAVEPALNRAARYQTLGETEKARRIWDALETFYRDDPGARRVITAIQAARTKASK